MTDRILFLSDNQAILDGLAAFAETQPWGRRVDLACSPGSPVKGVRTIRLRDEVPESMEDRDGLTLRQRYALIVSGHSKQIFPKEIVQSILCVNLHPGFNPETRGWYPQVFSILGGHKIGLTVHVMDEEIDNGDIIFREHVSSYTWDTSRTLYERVVASEIASIPKWLPALVEGRFSSVPPEGKGNYYSKQDFRDACRLDLDEVGTFRQFYDRLRATSFPPFDNAYFIDPDDGKKVFVRIDTKRSSQQ